MGGLSFGAVTTVSIFNVAEVVSLLLKRPLWSEHQTGKTRSASRGE